MKYLVLALMFLVSAFFAEITLLSIEVNETDHAFDYFEQAPLPLKTLIVGQCEAATNIAPAYLGKNVFNFSLYDLNFYYQRKLLQRILIDTKPEAVILTVNPLMFMGKYRMPSYVQRYFWFKKGILPDSRDIISTLTSFGNHSRLWNEKMKQFFFKENSSAPPQLEFASTMSSAPLLEISKETYYRDGFRAMTDKFDSEYVDKMLDELITNFDFADDKSDLDELQSILTILRNSKIKTTLLLLPQISGLQEKMEDKVPGTEKKLQETLASISKIFPEVFIHDLRSNHHIPDDMFSEPGHLSVKGADLFGPQLKKILNDQHH